MIENIRGISIRGRCYEDTSPLALFQDKQRDNKNKGKDKGKEKDTEKCRLSIVFGKNGSGKSTIADAFSQIERDASADAAGKPHEPSELDAFLIGNDKSGSRVKANAGEIFVFNEKYIDENVKVASNGLGTIVLLGEKVGLQEQIDKCREKQKEAKAILDDADDKHKPFLSSKNPVSPDFHIARIKGILKNGWQQREIQFNSKRPNITPNVINEIGGMKIRCADKDLWKMFNDKLGQFRGFMETENITLEALPLEIRLGDGKEEELRALLARKLTEPVLTEREKRIMEVIQHKLGFAVTDSKKYFETPSTDFCPYCFRPVSHQEKEDIIHSIDIVLNKDVEEHAQELASFAEFINNVDNNVQLVVTSLKRADKKSIITLGLQNLVQDIQTAAEQYSDMIHHCLSHIKDKQQHPYTPIAMNMNLLEKERTLNDLLKKYRREREKYSQNQKEKDSRIKALRDELSQLNRQISSGEIAQSYVDYQAQEKAKRECEAEYAKKQEEYEAVCAQMEKLLRANADVVIATEKINRLLDFVFFHRGRLSIEFADNAYRLKTNGKDVRPKEVSSGERNIIALCYFFTQLLHGQKKSEFYTKKMLVVIDDPISSIDFENRIGIQSLLRYQIRRIIMGCSDSKVVVLSHDLPAVLDFGKAMQEISAASKRKAGMHTDYTFWELNNQQLHPFQEKKRNEYSMLLDRTYQFACGVTDDELTIGNVMRRMLEAFSSFSYRKGIEEISTAPEILKVIGSRSMYFDSLMYRLVLHGESHYEDRVRTMDNGMDFFEFISPEEKQITAKNVLCFMYLLNPLHVKEYMGIGSSRIRQIESWIQEIPDNDTLSGNRKTMKIPMPRKANTIPLYTFSISAGSGNEIPEEAIPFDEFKTENPSADYALRISGNSMEPMIPDGSIVLIRRTKEILDGKIGAFYLDGDVYCKKYRKDNNGTVWLESFNPDYSDIIISEYNTVRLLGVVTGIIPPDSE